MKPRCLLFPRAQRGAIGGLVRPVSRPRCCSNPPWRKPSIRRASSWRFSSATWWPQSIAAPRTSVAQARQISRMSCRRRGRGRPGAARCQQRARYPSAGGTVFGVLVAVLTEPCPIVLEHRRGRLPGRAGRAAGRRMPPAPMCSGRCRVPGVRIPVDHSLGRLVELAEEPPVPPAARERQSARSSRSSSGMVSIATSRATDRSAPARVALRRKHLDHARPRRIARARAPASFRRHPAPSRASCTARPSTTRRSRAGRGRRPCARARGALRPCARSRACVGAHARARRAAPGPRCRTRSVAPAPPSTCATVNPSKNATASHAPAAPMTVAPRRNTGLSRNQAPICRNTLRGCKRSHLFVARARVRARKQVAGVSDMWYLGSAGDHDRGGEGCRARYCQVACGVAPRTLLQHPLRGYCPRSRRREGSAPSACDCDVFGW